jgi:hypothetical protein
MLLLLPETPLEVPSETPLNVPARVYFYISYRGACHDVIAIRGTTITYIQTGTPPAAPAE